MYQVIASVFAVVFRRCAPAFIAAILLGPLLYPILTGFASDKAFAQSPDTAEAKAFEESKALGTVEAWNAYIANFPTGFHADLARAYLKQLSAGAPPAPAPQQAAAPQQPAVELSCDEQPTLKSRESREPAKLRFKNESEGTIVLQWIDFNGALKEFGTLEPGAEITQETFLTHPWIAAYGEGSCRQLFLPAPGISLARLKPESELPKKAAPKAQPKPTRNDPPPPLKCAPNYKKVGNQCVLLQNCGANATRTPEGDCFCNNGFQMMNGQCQIPRQRANQCSRHEVYSSSMGQCIPKSAMCEANEVYSSSMAQCIPRSAGR